MKDRVALKGGIKLCSENALYIRDDEALAIADLHLGYEAALQAEHVAIPRFQLGLMKERLARLLAEFSPRTVVINGDMKHGFSGNRSQEWDEVVAVLDMLEGIEVAAVRGNHDNFLQNMLSRRGIGIADSVALPESGVRFVHGHKRAGEHAGLTVYAHEHPVVRMRDEVGARLTAPCFLHDHSRRILVMPAFSPLASGTDVLSGAEAFLSPDLRGLDLSGARVHAVQGGILDLGAVADVRLFVKGNSRRES
jgi:hypothetical protein